MSTIDQAAPLLHAGLVAGLAGFDGDLCPPGWPHRWPPRPWPPHRKFDFTVDMRAADRAFDALTLIASSLLWNSDALARDLRTVALTHLRDAGPVLARGAAAMWGDDWCKTVPRRPPGWPFGGSNPMPGRDVLPPSLRAAVTAVELLGAYDAAAQLADDKMRLNATQAIGAAFVDQLAHVERSLG